MEASSMAASRRFTFMCFLLPHWVPAAWCGLAQTSMRAELPSGKQPTTWVRQRISRPGRPCPMTIRTAPALNASSYRGGAECLCSFADMVLTPSLFIIRLISLSGKSGIGGKVNPQIASTEDAAALAGMDWNEGIGTAEPLVLDNALDAVTARHKGIDSPVSNSSSTV